MGKITVLLVDDEALMREGLRVMLEKEPFTKQVLEASNEIEFLNQVSTHRIDLILLDIRLQQRTNGLELLKKVKTDYPKCKVVAVTGLEGVELVVNLLKVGCNGIVYKLDGYREVLRTIQALLDGDSYFPDKIMKIINSNSRLWDKAPTVLLTFHEKELIKAIAGGGTTKQIAHELRLKPTTAETYRVRLMKKMGVPNTASMLAYAYRNGIL